MCSFSAVERKWKKILQIETTHTLDPMFDTCDSMHLWEQEMTDIVNHQKASPDIEHVIILLLMLLINIALVISINPFVHGSSL